MRILWKEFLTGFIKGLAPLVRLIPKLLVGTGFGMMLLLAGLAAAGLGVMVLAEPLLAGGALVLLFVSMAAWLAMLKGLEINQRRN